MKQNIVVYLAKEETNIDDIVDRSKSPSRIEIDEEGFNGVLYLKKSESQPSWLSLFRNADIPNIFNRQKSIKGLLVLHISNRYLLLTFGHGRSLINLNKIVRGFGLRVAMNLGDPNQLKSIDKSKLDQVALNTRTQSSINTNLDNFDFEYDHEIMKSLTAIINNNDNNLEVVSGSDSVSIYTDITSVNLLDQMRRLLNAYNLEVYKTNYPWADYIKPETDPTIIHRLDTQLCSQLNSNEYEDLWLSPSEVIDYSNFSGFKYKNTTELHLELSLESFLRNTRFIGDITTNKLKSKKICVFNADNIQVNSWNAFNCLNGEIEIDDTKFILNDGQWYKIESRFYDVINEYFTRLNRSTLPLPDYGGLTEAQYLKHVERTTNIALLDQKWVRPVNVPNNLEFCDLLTPCNAIVHVKQYGSSSVLNHLFAQAYQSVEMLLNCPEVIDQVNEHLEEYPIFLNFDPSNQIRPYRIVLAIMDKYEREIHMPFFAKVNLRHQARKMISMGFNVELLKIDIGDFLNPANLD